MRIFKVSVLLFGIVFISALAFKKGKRDNDLLKDGLNGRVKTIELITYQPNNETDTFSIGEPSESSVITYNKQGFKLEESFYSASGEIGLQTKYTLTKKGKPSAKYQYYSGKLSSSEKWSYDKKGNLLEHSIYQEDGSLYYKVNSTYNKKGHLLQQLILKGEIPEKCTFKNDKHGNVLAKSYYSADGNLTLREEWSYDSKDSRIEHITLSPEGEVYSKELYFFNEKNREVETKNYDDQGLLISSTKNDNSGNEILSEQYNADGIVTHKLISTYNNHGSITSVIAVQYGEETSRTKYTYKFDKEGNWTNTTVLINEIATSVFIRNIEYFN